MNTAISIGILFLFLVSVLISLFLLFKQDKFKQLKFNITSTEQKGFLITLFSVCALLTLQTFLVPEPVWSNIAIFAISFAIPFLLRRLGFTYESLAVILLLFVVLPVAIIGGGLSAVTLLTVLLGLIVYKLLENLSFSVDDYCNDIVPSFIWLVVLAWANLTGKADMHIENILLSCFSIAILLKCLPASFITKDRFFLKRVVLSASAGLALFIILTKFLLLPKMTILAALYAAGLFFAYLFESNNTSDDNMNNLMRSTTFLVLIGILTLVATRLVGDIGFIALSSACILCTGANIVIFAALFWLSRLLMQSFVFVYIANVTGINLMHPYCSAALYFGVFAICFLSLVLRFGGKKWLTEAAMLFLGLLAPPAIIYLIHEEATASFLIAANVAAISLFAFSPLFLKGQNSLRQGNIMLMPLMMSVTSFLCGEFITIGNQATVASRFQIVSYVGAGILVIYFILIYLSRSMCNNISVFGDKS